MSTFEPYITCPKKGCGKIAKADHIGPTDTYYTYRCPAGHETLKPVR